MDRDIVDIVVVEHRVVLIGDAHMHVFVWVEVHVGIGGLKIKIILK